MTSILTLKRIGIGYKLGLCLLALLCTPAWSSVFVHWTSSALPPASALGASDLVVTWDGNASPLLEAARRQGYRVYVEVPLKQAPAAAEKAAQSGLAGIILNVRQSERAEVESVLSGLCSAYPKLRFLILNPDGKQPQMRGSLIIKRGSVLEVSSPTAQPWIDTNLALVKVEQRSHEDQAPLYTYSLSPGDSGQQPKGMTATDYSLAVAEAGAFHADLILDVDERLQKALSERVPEAWTLWNQVRTYVNFYSNSAVRGLQTAANVGVVVDDLDPTDEVMNLLARHNIPFKVLRPPDLKSEKLDALDVIVVFVKPDTAACERIVDLATRGKTVVLVDAQGSYPWQKSDPVRLNEHSVSYAVGGGKVLELAEPVTDPETFAQDIRRLLGKQNSLMSLWNGLTTIAVPYRAPEGAVKVLEFVNYAAEPLRVQVQVKGSFSSIRFETPEHKCCESLAPVMRSGFTEFVIPDLSIGGRVYLEGNQPAAPHQVAK
jgi:protein-tyrosine-phosphatase